MIPDRRLRRFTTSAASIIDKEWDDAVRAFDVLLQSHPDNKKLIPEALYYKADSLARLNRLADADQTLADLHKRFPNDAMSKRSLTVKPPAAH